MKKFLSITLSLVLLFSLLSLCSCNEQKSKYITKDEMTVVFFGDSITDARTEQDRKDDTNLGGWGGRSHPVQIKELFECLYPKTSFNFYNLGISGDTTWGMYNRIDTVLNYKPDMIIMLAGVNDTWAQGDNNQMTKESYTKILTTFNEKLPDTTVVVIEPFMIPVNDLQRTKNHDLVLAKAAVIEQVASEFECIFVAVDAELNANCTDYVTAKTYSHDGIHLNEPGYDIVTQQIMAELDMEYLTKDQIIERTANNK